MGEGYVATMINMFLGPHGRYLSEFYIQHQLIINGLLLGGIVIKKTRDYLHSS
jgi:hypothetical protein